MTTQEITSRKDQCMGSNNLHSRLGRRRCSKEINITFAILQDQS